MKKHTLAAIIAVGTVVFMGGPSLAQQTQNQSMLSLADRRYLTKAAFGSTYEFELAQLGVQKAASNATEQYALRLLNDHANFNTQLMQLAHQNHVTLPVSVTSSDKSKLQQFKQLEGNAFDRAFAQEMARINSQDISDSQQEANQTQSSDIRSFIARFEATDREHLQLARNLLNASTAQR